MNNILVIGANGKVGRMVVSNLIAKGKKVRAMIRSNNQAEVMLSSGAEIFIGDLEKDFRNAFEDIDCVIFTAGSGSHTGPDKTILVDQEGAKRSIDFAVQFNVERYIMVSAQGARDPEIPGKIQHYYKAKKIADDYLVQSGLKYTIFRPGRLLDDAAKEKVELSEYFIGKGTTRRADLAYAIAECISISNTEYKIIEIIEGEKDIITALRLF